MMGVHNHTHLYAVCTQVYTDIHGYIKYTGHTFIYVGIKRRHKYTQVYTQVNTGIHWYTLVYTSIHKYTQVYTRIYTQLHTGIHKYIQAYTYIHKYT